MIEGQIREIVGGMTDEQRERFERGTDPGYGNLSPQFRKALAKKIAGRNLKKADKLALRDERTKCGRTGILTLSASLREAGLL